MWELLEWKLIVSAIIGGVLTVLGQIIVEFVKTRKQRQLETERKKLLRKILNKDKMAWRPMNMLSRVIGADREETARLLLLIGARGNELDEGKDVWAYIESYPIK